MLEVAEPTPESSPLLLGIDAGEGLLSEDLPVDLRTRASRHVGQQKEPDEREGGSSQEFEVKSSPCPRSCKVPRD